MAKPIKKTKKEIMKMKEGLATRKIISASGPGISNYISYDTGIDNNYENISRRIKSEVLPKLSELLYSVENCYNSYVTDYNDEKKAKEKEKVLKPLKIIYTHLEKGEDDLIDLIKSLKGK